MYALTNVCSCSLSSLFLTPLNVLVQSLYSHHFVQQEMCALHYITYPVPNKVCS